MTQQPSNREAVAAICDAIRRADRFIVTSHVRPDGDAIGSAVAMSLALRALGKSSRVIFRDPVPEAYLDFPATSDIEFAESVPDDGATVIVMECGSVDRAGLAGLDRHDIINIDHHPGNTGFGTWQWFDGQAAACAEMVAELIDALGVPLSREMATHIYVAVVTDTGWFRYPGVSPRTFQTAARLVAAGADPVTTSRTLNDSHSLGRLKLQAAVLQTLEIHRDGAIATLSVDAATIAAAGATPEDTDGLINIPLSVRHLVAVAFFKPGEDGQVRVSMRSKGAVDVGGIARSHGGGGHRNAAGCTLTGALADVKARILEQVAAAVARADSSHPPAHA